MRRNEATSDHWKNQLPFFQWLEKGAEAGSACPEAADGVGGHFGLALAGEDTFFVADNAGVNLSGHEVGKVPDVLADHKRFGRAQLERFFDELGLVFLAEDKGRQGMESGNAVGAEFGEDDGAFVLLMNLVELFAHGFE